MPEQTNAARETNWDAIQWGHVRQKLDHHFRALADDLKQAFKGPYDGERKYPPGRGWRNGETSLTFEGKTLAQWAAVFGLDPRAEATAETVFNKLYADIWELHILAIHEQNLAEPEKDRIPKPEYDEIRVAGKTASRVERARDLLKDRKANALGEYDALKAWATRAGLSLDETRAD